MTRRPPRSPLSPYPPLFRSVCGIHRFRQPPQKAIEWLLCPDYGIRLTELRAWLGGAHACGADLQAFAESLTALSGRSEEHTSELQSPCNIVCRLLLEQKKKE